MRRRVDTARLVGIAPREGDVAALEIVVADPRVAQCLWPHRPAPAPAELLDRFAGHWREHGFGPWVFRERTSGDAIGYAGPQRTEVEGAAEVEILYAVASARWGEGLATEMAGASIDAALQEPGVTGLVCFTRTTNAASRRVMEKAGFRYERDFERAGLPHALYRLSR